MEAVHVVVLPVGGIVESNKTMPMHTGMGNDSAF